MLSVGTLEYIPEQQVFMFFAFATSILYCTGSFSFSMSRIKMRQQLHQTSCCPRENRTNRSSVHLLCIKLSDAKYLNNLALQNVYPPLYRLVFVFFGHVSRRDNDSIERLFVQEIIEGTKSRGISPMGQIKVAVAVLLRECARKAAAIEEWRWIVKRALTLM
ncbi:jg9885 [Pararge aegeria aegeria]|uniref:Jg9885 protein n=1 Tax=Pararge aegeria aegeria TaxID=348720 RepID=A0A8S4RHK9_9NEOP|nr:jg9885 [Pararge aegeria aegeria]